MAKSFNARMRDRFARITSNIQKQNDYIHETGMMLLRHAAPESLGGYGDCSLAAAFVRSLPASMRREMLVAWLAKYSPISVRLGDSEAADKKGFNVKYKALKDDEAKAACWDLAGADEEPFWRIAEATPEVRRMTLEQLIALASSLGNRIEKIADNENEKVTLAEGTDVAAAKALAAKLKAIAA